MVDLTRDQHGRTRARLLDLVPGRSGQAYKTWLTERGDTFRAGVEIATLDPFRGYKNAIDDQLDDARAVLDAFHVVKLATAVVDDPHPGRDRGDTPRAASPDPDPGGRRPLLHGPRRRHRHTPHRDPHRRLAQPH